MRPSSQLSYALIIAFFLVSFISLTHASSEPSDGTYLPPLNTFVSIPPNNDLNSAYQFGVVPTTFTTFYGNLEVDTVNYFTVDITDPSQVIRVTLFRSVEPGSTECTSLTFFFFFLKKKQF